MCGFHLPPADVEEKGWTNSLAGLSGDNRPSPGGLGGDWWLFSFVIIFREGELQIFLSQRCFT